jgi:hypothetical protein
MLRDKKLSVSFDTFRAPLAVNFPFSVILAKIPSLSSLKNAGITCSINIVPKPSLASLAIHMAGYLPPLLRSPLDEIHRPFMFRRSNHAGSAIVDDLRVQAIGPSMSQETSLLL